MSRDLSQGLTRREALAAGAASLGALAFGTNPALADVSAQYGPFKMGLQSYSLRHFKLEEALAKTKELGVHYWEAYPGHIPTDAAKAAEYKAAAKAAGVAVVGYGVSRFTKNTDTNRKYFEFARAMGIEYLSADPDIDAFDSLDKLVAEYGVAIGIHPHGPGHKWDKIDKIWAAVKDHNEKIGICNDTGHLLRSNEDPVRAVEVFGKRTYGVHLKDVKDATTFTILGQGDLKMPELFRALASIGYNYAMALEYEEHELDPMADIKLCLEAAAKAIPGPRRPVSPRPAAAINKAADKL
jgi:inosose dehydratase